MVHFKTHARSTATDTVLHAPVDDSRSIPAMVRAACASHDLANAVYRRDQEGWQGIASSALWQRVARTASGLRQMGLQPGTCVGILAAPSPEWLITDLAVQLAGAVSVPMFPNAAQETLAHIVQDADLRWCFVDGEESRRAFVPLHRHVHRVFGIDPDEGLGSFSLGAIASRGSDDDAAQLLGQLGGDDLATIIYTSGSTGPPKGVRLTHGNLTSQVAAASMRFPLVAGQDVACSCLPWAHVFERMVLYTYLACGVPIYVCDDVTRLGERLPEIKPTIMTVVPRLLEKLYARIRSAAEKAPGLRGHLASWALQQAAGDGAHGLGGIIADRLVYRAVRARLGGRLHCVICGGAALSPAIEHFFGEVGVPVYPGYGMTEASPVITTNCPGDHRPGTVGHPFPAVEVRIGPQDEILTRGPGVMAGYHHCPAATAAAIDGEGWLHTGDCGRLDADGYLTITGRLKELMKTSGGKYVCPIPIEQLLAADPLIDQAMVVADGRPFVSALLFPDPTALATLKQELDCADLDDATFAERPEITAYLDRLVASVNRQLDHWQQIRRWHLLTAPPSIENGELTPTMKLRRRAVVDHYREAISGLYRRKSS